VGYGIRVGIHVACAVRGAGSKASHFQGWSRCMGITPCCPDPTLPNAHTLANPSRSRANNGVAFHVPCAFLVCMGPVYCRRYSAWSYRRLRRPQRKRRMRLASATAATVSKLKGGLRKCCVFAFGTPWPNIDPSAIACPTHKHLEPGVAPATPQLATH
jgi:hypothetical protein